MTPFFPGQWNQSRPAARFLPSGKRVRQRDRRRAPYLHCLWNLAATGRSWQVLPQSWLRGSGFGRHSDLRHHQGGHWPSLRNLRHGRQSAYRLNNRASLSGSSPYPSGQGPSTLPDGSGKRTGPAESAFVNPAFDQVPTVRRNQFYGPNQVDTDAVFEKDQTITERFKLIFRAESYNVFNHPLFLQPASGILGERQFWRLNRYPDAERRNHHGQADSGFTEAGFLSNLCSVSIHRRVKE
jgi:hypothetical protein